MKKKSFLAALSLGTCFLLAFTGCSLGDVYITDVSFAQTDEGTLVTYTYSDGSTKTHLESGKDGKDGKDGQDLTGQSVYELWLEKNELTDTSENYDAFLKSLNLELAQDDGKAVQSTLNSVATIYCEYVYSKTNSSGSWWSGSSSKSYGIGMSIGSGFIYGMNDGYAYLVTNAHVVYCDDADQEANGGYYPKDIHCFLYGSYDPDNDYGGSGRKDPTYGYQLVEYSSYAVKCELVGVSVSTDLAVVRARTSDLKRINSQIQPVTLADDYYVGQTVFAVGNTDVEGLSATKGIISVDNEEISLEIGKKERTYRSMRFDGYIFEGNSGGALFDATGKVVGVCHAGDNATEHMNYAIPLNILTGVVNSIIDNYSGDVTLAKKVTLGITVNSTDVKYEYNARKGYGKITEKIQISTVSTGSIAEKLGLRTGDVLTSLTIDGKEYEINRSFDITDALFNVRAGSNLTANYKRTIIPLQGSCKIEASDLVTVE